MSVTRNRCILHSCNLCTRGVPCIVGCSVQPLFLLCHCELTFSVPSQLAMIFDYRASCTIYFSMPIERGGGKQGFALIRAGKVYKGMQKVS